VKQPRPPNAPEPSNVPPLDIRGDPRDVVRGDANLNTNGEKNSADNVRRLAIDSRGALRLCGKPGSSGQECTNQVFLYLEDGTGRLLAKPGNGTTGPLAAP
jgi:hypothetical protein